MRSRGAGEVQIFSRPAAGFKHPQPHRRQLIPQGIVRARWRPCPALAGHDGSEGGIVPASLERPYCDVKALGDTILLKAVLPFLKRLRQGVALVGGKVTYQR